MPFYKFFKCMLRRVRSPSSTAQGSTDTALDRGSTQEHRDDVSPGKAARVLARFKRPLQRKRLPADSAPTNTCIDTRQHAVASVEAHRWLTLDPMTDTNNHRDAIDDASTDEVVSTSSRASTEEYHKAPSSVSSLDPTVHLTSKPAITAETNAVQTPSIDSDDTLYGGPVLPNPKVDVRRRFSDSALLKPHTFSWTTDDTLGISPGPSMVSEQLEMLDIFQNVPEISSLACQTVKPDAASTDYLAGLSDDTTYISTDGSSAVENGTESNVADGTDEQTTTMDRARIQPQDWDTINQIPDSQFEGLLYFAITHLDSGFKAGEVAREQCCVLRRIRGGYNYVVMMAIVGNGLEEYYVVRVPAIGTAARWQDGDAHNMQREVALMNYLQQKTKIPVPDVLFFEDGLDSYIGAPYILMKRLPGQPAYKRWYESPNHMDWSTTGQVPPEVEAVRCNILRSLATIMAELKDLEFDKIGMPNFVETDQSSQKPTVTHSYRWGYSEDDSDSECSDDDADSGSDMEDTASESDVQGQLYEFGPFTSSREFMTRDIENVLSLTPDPDVEDESQRSMVVGARKILDIIYGTHIMSASKHDPLDNDEPETFVLRHPDLDLQNILTDKEGNITGIIDWEGCMAVPRCVGYASYPEFLRRDWTTGWSLHTVPFLAPFQLAHYRQVYADAMLATGCPDAKYTRKSAMYRAIVDCVNGDDNLTCHVRDLIQKMFAQIPELNTMDIGEFEACVGAGWKLAEAFLVKTIGKLVDPET